MRGALENMEVKECSSENSSKRFFMALLVFLQTLHVSVDVSARDQRIDAISLNDLTIPNKLERNGTLSHVCTDTWEYTTEYLPGKSGSTREFTVNISPPAEQWVTDWSRGLENLDDPKGYWLSSRAKHKYEIAKKRFQNSIHFIQIPEQRFKYRTDSGKITFPWKEHGEQLLQQLLTENVFTRTYKPTGKAAGSDHQRDVTEGRSSNVFVQSFERVDDDSKTLDLFFYEMKEWNGSGTYLKTNAGERRGVSMSKVASTIICPSVNDLLGVRNVSPNLNWSENIVFKDELNQPTDKLSTNPMIKLTLHWGFIYHQDWDLDLMDQYQQIFLLTVHPMITLTPSSTLKELDL